MEGSIQIQKYGFTENFVPKNMGTTIFIDTWVSMNNFQLNITSTALANTH